MEWLKLDLKTLRSPEYIGSEPPERATWLNLLAYCAEQENGGTIEECAEWKDRMWQQLTGVTLAEVNLKTQLYSWEGSSLQVWAYPKNAESLVKTRREAGRKGGAQSSENFALSKTEAKTDFASTEQSRAEQSRADNIRAEQRGAKPGYASCKGLDWDSVLNWMDLQNGSIPDRHRAESLARELMQEMDGRKWRLESGEPVGNPMGLLISRLKQDGAYKPKGT